MTPHAPSHFPQDPTTTRTRVKWDNIAIVLFGAVVASFAVIGIMASGDTTPARKATPEPAKTAPALDEPTVETALTLEDAEGLVEESRSFMTEARWDEAADRLATVPEELRDSVGVPALEEELAATRATHDRLRAELDAAVEARQWKPARALITQLEKIATLDAELLEIQAQVDRALAPRTETKDAKPAADRAESATAATTTGGGAAKPANTSTTRPAAQTTKPKPAAQRPKPAATTGTATTGGGSTGGSGTSTGATAGAVSGQLTDAQQQELEQALADALGTAELEGLGAEL